LSLIEFLFSSYAKRPLAALTFSSVAKSTLAEKYLYWACRSFEKKVV